MISTKPKTADSPAPKRGLPFDIAFKPNFKASMLPIGESTRVFVNLIAMLFAMNGLFPKDHPALVPNSNAPLSLFEVISTAWNSLTFTEKDIPKTLFFFVAVGCMVITTLMVIIGLFSLFVGTAHAQSAFFTPPPQDLAQNWIDYMFNGTALLDTYNQAGSNVPANTTTGNLNMQCAMMIALGFYSNAVLMVAALILFYHLAWMVVETAHHGKVMGKRGNEVWAPIRLVVAVGLLVPISNNPPAQCPTNTGAGLNSAQYITIKIAELGSALASNVWIKFVDALVGGQWQFIPPSTPDVQRIVADIFLMESCVNAWNHFEVTDITPQGSPNYMNAPPVTGSTTDPIVGTKWDYQSNVINEQDRCGSIIEAPGPTASTSDSAADPLYNQVPLQTQTEQAIYNAHMRALQNAITNIRGLAANDIVYQVPDWNSQQNGDADPPDNEEFQNAVQSYYTDLTQQLTAAFNGPQDTLPSEALTAPGWIAAGTWMNTIARDQGSLSDAVYDGLPRTRDPHLGDIGTSVSRDTQEALYNLTGWMRQGYAAPQNAPIAPCDLQNGAMGGNAGKRFTNNDEVSPFTLILQGVDALAVKNGLWAADENYTCPNGAPLFTLGKQFTTSNPFGELTNLGQKSMHVAVSLMNGMIWLTAANAIGTAMKGHFGDKFKELTDAEKDGPGAVKARLQQVLGDLGGTLADIGAAVIPILGFMAVVFFTVGITLGYILPLIPFMHFFFATVAWGLVLLEAIIAMPLVALAHLNPEGDGLPGNMARQAYFMLLGLFMRPAMIVFALIASLLIFFLSMFLLNKLFAVTVVGTGAAGQGLATLSRIIFTILYVFLAYTCAVNCFKIIDSLPEAVFRWINISLGHQRLGDGGSALQSAGGVVSGVVSQQAMGAFQGAGEKGSKVAGDLVTAITNQGKNPVSSLGKGP